MKILSYSEDNLASALSNKFTSPALVKAKNHFDYFKKYLASSGLDAKAILIEENYISRDFLHDYASYYALCFEKHEKVCRRVHFFDIEINEEEFSRMLLLPKEDTVEFWQGFSPKAREFNYYTHNLLLPIYERLRRSIPVCAQMIGYY